MLQWIPTSLKRSASFNLLYMRFVWVPHPFRALGGSVSVANTGAVLKSFCFMKPYSNRSHLYLSNVSDDCATSKVVVLSSGTLSNKQFLYLVHQSKNLRFKVERFRFYGQFNRQCLWFLDHEQLKHALVVMNVSSRNGCDWCQISLPVKCLCYKRAYKFGIENWYFLKWYNI